MIVSTLKNLKLFIGTSKQQQLVLLIATLFDCHNSRQGTRGN